MCEACLNEKDIEKFFPKIDRVKDLNRCIRVEIQSLSKGEKPSPLFRKRIAHLMALNNAQRQAIQETIDFISDKGFPYPIPF